MPNSPSAKKSLRLADSNRRKNFKRKQSLKSTKKTAVVNPSKETLAAAYKSIDKAAKTGLLKSKSAARRKSRLAKTINRSAKK